MEVPISFAIQAVANFSAAMAQAAIDAQAGSTAISMANNAPGGGSAGRPGFGSQAQGAAGTDLHAGNAASTDHGGALTSSNEGAIGLRDFTLSSGALITSSTNNVRLERETRFVLRVNGH